MKKLVAGMLVLAMSAGSYLKAQDVDGIKNMYILQQYDKAKVEMEKAMTKPKFAAKPEAHILQSSILAGLMGLDANKGNKELRASAEASYEKYLSLDPEKKLIKDDYYVNTPVQFYSSHYQEGIENYNAKAWPEACTAFDNTVKWSNFLIANEMLTTKFDTTAILLAGASYQNAKNEEKAVEYFTMLADRKIGSDDNEFLYQFLTRYWFYKNDMAKFNNFKSIGAELYPNSEYFKYTEDDFILGMDDEAEKGRRIQEKIAKDPSNIKLLETYGLMLFNELNAEEGTLPENAEEKERLMLEAFSKVAATDPTNASVLYYAGAHYNNKKVRLQQESEKITDEIRKIQAEAKPDPKTGKKPAPPAELVAKRKALNDQADAAFLKAMPFYMKSLDAFKAKGSSLTGIEKRDYKTVADLMIVYYEEQYKKETDPAKKKKIEAEIAKYSQLYDSIK